MAKNTAKSAKPKPHGRLWRKLLSLLLMAGVCGGGWWFVHQDMVQQQRALERSHGLLRPLVHVGESVTVVTDSLGWGGKDVWAESLSRLPRTDFYYGGMPRSRTPLRVLRNMGYVVGYSEERKSPAWAAYRVFRVPQLVSSPRPRTFEIDQRTEARVHPEDYLDTNYDRGHVAPNFAIATRYGREAQLQTFLMSNVLPQSPRLNQHSWRALEKRIAVQYGMCCDEVWVISGPIYGANPAKLPTGIAVPTAFFTIMVDEYDGGKVRTLAFVLTQDVHRHEWLRRHLVSIDQVESMTGLNFFPELPASIERKLESDRATRMWPMPVTMVFKDIFHIKMPDLTL